MTKCAIVKGVLPLQISITLKQNDGWEEFLNEHIF